MRWHEGIRSPVHPYPIHDDNRVPGACDCQCLHAKAAITVVLKEHTMTISTVHCFYYISANSIIDMVVVIVVGSSCSVPIITDMRIMHITDVTMKGNYVVATLVFPR